MANHRVPFELDTIYHVYNHGNGEDLIFREVENYRFFLKRFKTYINPIAKIYAYCLMPNHFHFLLKIRSEAELCNHFEETYSDFDRTEMSHEDIATLLSNQFKNLLISYSKSYNNMYNRRGSLFLDNIKRIPILNDDYYANIIRYIHFNPLIHGFTSKSEEWKFSSLHSYYSNKRSTICRKDVFEWFGGAEQFKKFHQSIERDEFDSLNPILFG